MVSVFLALASGLELSELMRRDLDVQAALHMMVSVRVKGGVRVKQRRNTDE